MLSANDLPFSEITRKEKKNQILHLSCHFYTMLHLICQFYANTHLPSQFHTLVSHFTQVMPLAGHFYKAVSHFYTLMISSQQLLCGDGKWLAIFMQ